jgi:peptidoglycan-associated lipoprotein
MKKSMIFFTIALFIVGMSFSGCAKKAVKTEAGGEMPAAEARPTFEELETLEVEDIEVMEGSAEEPLTAPRLDAVAEAKEVLQDIFFDYNRYAIRDDARETLYENAQYLKVNKKVRITIEGHCDERGTIEYNVALGERRAMAVKRFLEDMGVESHRIAILSYGKEKLFCIEHTEDCWQENRRAHTVVK